MWLCFRASWEVVGAETVNGGQTETIGEVVKNQG
jgi:hypothetical protein